MWDLEGQGQAAQVVVGVLGEIRLPARRTPDLEALARADDQRLDRDAVGPTFAVPAELAAAAMSAIGAVQPSVGAKPCREHDTPLGIQFQLEGAAKEVTLDV